MEIIGGSVIRLGLRLCPPLTGSNGVSAPPDPSSGP
jgi:hypothetical protein